MKIIRLDEHPSNLDPTATIVGSSRSMGRPGVYKVRRGYVAALPNEMAIDGHFASGDEALAAQRRMMTGVVP